MEGGVEVGVVLETALAMWERDERMRAQLEASVPREAMERRCARLQRQIDESHAALRRRNAKIERLQELADNQAMAVRDLSERAMPPGMEWLIDVWPKWDNGDYCKFGDWWTAESYGEDRPRQLSKLSIYTPEFLSDLGQGNGESYGYEWDFFRPRNVEYHPVKVEPPAPKVLDADGVEIRVGEMVWDIHTGERMTIDGITGAGGAYETCRVTLESGEQTTCDGPRLTHRAPVIAADGEPLEVGQTVWGVNGGAYRVTGVRNGKVFARRVGGSFGAEVESAGGSGLYRLRADQLTHEQPDTWERIEADSKLAPREYLSARGIEPIKFGTVAQQCADLVRRARRLAERGQR